MEIPFLLPHEILHALHGAGPMQAGGQEALFPFGSLRVCLCVSASLQFGRSMTGFLEADEIKHFWQHAKMQREFANHPLLHDGDNTERLQAWYASLFFFIVTICCLDNLMGILPPEVRIAARGAARRWC